MKLGLQTGYWSSGPPAGVTEQIQAAERLGFNSIWTAEAYGSDAFTPLAWWGASTTRVKLGTSIVQLSARTPAATAMAAMTMDHLSGGRFILGLGASGPQVVEGWYGQPYPKPLARTREYVDIVRRIIARDQPVTSDGPHYPMPYPGGTGLGKPLKATVHPLRTEIPIYLGAEGPKNIALTAEIGDGWLPIFFSPDQDDWYRARLQEGFDQPGARHGWDDFEVAATAMIVPIDDLEEAANMLRPFLALYIGGMGARDTNFHFDVFARLGHEEACHRIQDLYLEGRKADAAAAVPLELVDQVALIGSAERIAERLEAWESSVVTTLLVSGPAELLEVVASIVQ